MNRVTAGIARAIYRAAIHLHPSARAGYAAEMMSTFDALLAPAAEHGVFAVTGLLVREITGLLRTAGPNRDAPPALPSPTRGGVVDAMWQDLRYAMRAFARRPGFTAALVLTLALGIGANTAIFSVVSAVLFQRLPFPQPNRLVMVWEEASSIGFPRNTPAVGNYADWKATIRAFEDVAALDQRDFNFAGDGEPEKIGGAAVTPNLFSVLGVPPFLGRTWRVDEDVPGNRVAVLSYGLWRRRFGADPGIINRTVLFNDAPYTVLGVMPPRFEILSPDLQIFVPSAFTAAQLEDRGDHYLSVVARLATGETVGQANAELGALAARLQRDHPDTNRVWGMYAVPLLDDYVGDTRTVLIVLLAAVGCVLLVACANVANLLLTRASGRTREMAVRAALGAHRGRLVRQLMTESVLLAAAGGALGIAVARASFGTLTRLVPGPLSDLGTVGLDVRVLAATATITLLTGVLFGLAPAWRASRVNLADAGGHRGSRGVVAGPSRLGHAIVVSEIALATVLLVGAGLLVESFRSIRDVDLGFRPEKVLTARVQLPRRGDADAEKRAQFVSAVLDRVRQLPGVVSAGDTSAVPLVWKGGTSGFRPEGLPRDPLLSYDANNRVVTPGYMETMAMTLRAGRFFDARDDANGEPAAIINERMAHQDRPGVDPIGRRFKAGSEGAAPAWRTIVGVVGDTHVMGVDQPTRAEMYFPLAQSGNNWMWPRDLAIRVTADPRAIAAAVRQAVWSVDPLQPVSNVQTMDDILDGELQGRRMQMTLMSAFAVLALILAAVGVYGVLSYAVTSRTAEIGLRLALGGDPGRIRLLVIRQGMTLAALGLAVGLGAAFFGTTLLERLLFHVSAHDSPTFVTQAGILALVCFLAAYIPARRASRVDPMTALRVE